MSYVSADMEEGYPGELTISVTYTLNDANQLQIDYAATTGVAPGPDIGGHVWGHCPWALRDFRGRGRLLWCGPRDVGWVLVTVVTNRKSGLAFLAVEEGWSRFGPVVRPSSDALADSFGVMKDTCLAQQD